MAANIDGSVRAAYRLDLARHLEKERFSMPLW
jgi:hypothetical protein